jgi:hypothetical protein
MLRISKGGTEGGTPRQAVTLWNLVAVFPTYLQYLLQSQSVPRCHSMFPPLPPFSSPLYPPALHWLRFVLLCGFGRWPGPGGYGSGVADPGSKWRMWWLSKWRELPRWYCTHGYGWTQESDIVICRAGVLYCFCCSALLYDKLKGTDLPLNVIAVHALIKTPIAITTYFYVSDLFFFFSRMLHCFTWA